MLASRGPKLISNGKTRLTLSPLYRVGGGRALAPRYWRNLASEFVVVLLLVTAPDGGVLALPPAKPYTSRPQDDPRTLNPTVATAILVIW